MDITWIITEEDKNLVKELVKKQSNTDMVCERRERNLKYPKPKVTKEVFWKEMVCARLTTLAKSGLNSPVEIFSRKSPFALSYNIMLQQQDLERFIHGKLTENKIGTHRQKISKDLVSNFNRLEGGEWDNTLKQCNRLISSTSRETEAEVAGYIKKTFQGFGSKQSRNVLQGIGLTRYEIPIDSRITNWLNDSLKFPFRVTPEALSDEHCYKFILDAICYLCEVCNVDPCMLDALVFDAQDNNDSRQKSLS